MPNRAGDYYVIYLRQKNKGKSDKSRTFYDFVVFLSQIGSIGLLFCRMMYALSKQNI